MAMLAGMGVINLAAAAAAFMLVLAVWVGGVLIWSLRKSLVEQQIEQRLGLGQPRGPTRQLRLWHDGKAAVTTVPTREPRPSITQMLAGLCRDAGWDIPAETLLLGMIGGSLLIFVTVLAITSQLVLAVATVIGALLIFWTYLRHRIAKRQELFDKQLVDGLELAARSLRAGHPLIASFRVISEEIPAPVGLLFSKVCQQQALGVALDQSLRSVAAETNSNDMKLFATSVIIQLRSGGNLADMMDRVAAVTRGRMRLTRHVRVLTAQTQFSKRVLLAMPFLIFVAMNALNPRYLEPLYRTYEGKWLMGIAATALLFGAWLMNHMARLRY